MIKINLLIIPLWILLSSNLFSQSKDSLDFKYFIEEITQDSSSNFFYPKLLIKIKTHPSEISVADCFYLYYGQIFQKNHNALSIIANPERLKFDKASMKGNCDKVLELGTIILERNPVDLVVLLSVCDCIKGKTDNYFLEQRFKNLLSAIFSTGDGNSAKTSIKIVDAEHDYVLKGVLGFLGGKEKLSSENNHFFSIWEKGTQKLYFEDIMNDE